MEIKKLSLQNKILLHSGVLLLVSLIAYVVVHLIWGRDVGILSLTLGAIFMLLHIGGTLYMLYRYAATRQRMNNRLQFINKLYIWTSFGALFIYMLLANILGSGFDEKMSYIRSVVLLILMAINVFYQENNTHNFVEINLHEVTNQSKKVVNQFLGIYIIWFTLILLWVGFGIKGHMPLYGFIYIALMIIQNSLSYTTFGQSRYWNFTYEALMIIHIYVLGLSKDNLLILVLAGILAIVFSLRQWIELDYSKSSMIVGIILIIIGNVGLYMDIFDFNLGHKMISQIIPYPAIMYIIVYGIVYLIYQPRFYKMLLKQ